MTDAPKCANCKHWIKHAISWGECTDKASAVYLNESVAMHVYQRRMQPDLGLCSMWEPKE